MISLAIPVRNARLQAIADAIDADTEPGTLTIYTGPRPSSGAPITTQAVLVEMPCPQPFADSIENGVLEGAPFAEAMASGQGEAVWGRFRDGSGAFVADADVGELDEQGDPTSDINMPETMLYMGALVRVASLTLAE